MAGDRRDVSVRRRGAVRLDPYRRWRGSRTLHEPTNRLKELPIHASKLLVATAFALVALGTSIAQAAPSAYPPGPTAQAAPMFPPGPTAQAAPMFPPGPSARAIIAI